MQEDPGRRIRQARGVGFVDPVGREPGGRARPATAFSVLPGPVDHGDRDHCRAIFPPGVPAMEAGQIVGAHQPDETRYTGSGA